MLAAHTLKALARQSGFSVAAVARAAPLDPEPLDTWLAAGHHASMDWMAKTREARLDPAKLLPGVQTVLALGACYLTPAHRLDVSAPIAPSAQGRDYHSVMRDKLKVLRRLLGSIDPSIETFATVDTAPIQEKAWAARAGLGWLGRHGLLVTPDHGTRVILATLLIDRAVDVFDAPLPSRCGACTRCLDVCPTGALLGDGRLDARRCLACQTIEESEGAFRPELLPLAGPAIFGCDVCQRACPWNRPEHACGDPKFAPRPLAALQLEAWAEMSDEAEFDALTRGTALRRAGFAGLRRNARAALAARR
ncbi:MAG: tRNA epoxyqueuosine(34) reductase QueG [Myxococcales bacterium]|jgi:epoxyqueuosine reductase|nr:tRNA epoxyqueuosine(34) reductase QueG [Myxococcales bacterium]